MHGYVIGYFTSIGLYASGYFHRCFALFFMFLVFTERRRSRSRSRERKKGGGQSKYNSKLKKIIVLKVNKFKIRHF